MKLEHRLPVLLQLHRHSRLNTWLQWIAQSQLLHIKGLTVLRIGDVWPVHRVWQVMTPLNPSNYVKHKSSISYLESDKDTSVMIDRGGDLLYLEHAISPLQVCAIDRMLEEIYDSTELIERRIQTKTDCLHYFESGIFIFRFVNVFSEMKRGLRNKHPSKYSDICVWSIVMQISKCSNYF